MKSSLTSVLFAFLFIVLIFNSQSAFADTKLSACETNPFWTNNLQSGLTMRTFNRIKTGMYLASVNKMIGFEGTVTYDARREDGVLVQAIKWEGSNYRIITAVFVGNRLTNKYQANLK